ncbi:BQ2448_6410 [Microbotryum intermedium]|uniref:BQ2448_6410 protein n=1 Tax=Microbotryum intermedium TaxID=269621 RepID=A0A238FJL3_9BASI|nr:BQ2448_6410 [Microbotryum intermedium]
MDSDMTDQLSTLATLRLALPSTLLLLLLVRFAAKGFVALIARIQAQGWVETDTDYGPVNAANTANTKVADGDDEDGIVPVVLVVKTPRRTWIVAFFGLQSLSTYVTRSDHWHSHTVISSLITSTFEPSEPLFRNMIPYTVGGSLSYILCAVFMTLQERARKKQADWGRVYPRALVLVGLAFDIAVAYHLGRVIQQASPLPSIHLGILVVRLLLLVMLSLLQSSLLHKRVYVPKDGSASDEGASLLGNGGVANGDGGDYGTIPGKPAYGPLRSSRPPSNRPPDPNSLSILTLFSRVRILFPYLWPSKSLSLQIVALVCLGLMLLKRVVNVWVPLLLGRIVSDLSAGRPPYLSIGLYTVMSFLQDSNSMLYQYLSLPIKQYSEREMSMLSFDCLLNLSLSYHTHRKTGELLRILGRSDAINDFFQILIFTFIPVIIDLPVAAVVIGYRYGLGIVSIVTGVSIVFVATSITLAESRTKLYRKLRDESQFMHQIKTDTLFNWETVKIFTAERFESERLRNALRVYQKGSFKVYSAWNSLSLTQDGISSVGFLICSFILSRRIVRGELQVRGSIDSYQNHDWMLTSHWLLVSFQVGEFVTFSSFLNQLYGPLNRIASLYRQVMSSLVDTEQLMELLNEKKDIVDRPNALPLVIPPGQGGTIEFDNVKFSYDDKSQTIKGVSFKVERGQSVALVGPSGSGKSTIMRLVYRFFDVSEGRILVDGVDVRDYSQVTLRNAIGLVPQESILFNETARYNIAYGGGIETTTEQMIEAAKSAAIHDRIMSFPDRYETRVGERGQRLSGGEKQRVAIARVLLKNPPTYHLPKVLLLDEATSALDTTNERLIQARLRELSRGRTTLAIAHRLSTIVDCDVIHVLAEGKIVESGSHIELLEQDGVYAELWRKQSESDETATPSAGPSRSSTSVVKTQDAASASHHL